MAATSTKPIVELDGASLLVGDRLLFRRTNWAIRSGEHWVLIGPNGSGKTLFASALTGAVPVVRGELRAPDGAVVHVSFEQQKALAGDAPAATRWFSLEEEDAPRVHQVLSQDGVEERNPFEIVTRSPAAARAFARRRQHVVKLLGIASLLDQPLPSLSNGEMRKLLLARALLRRPRLLILDDPFAGLDEKFRRHLKAILEKLIRRGTVHLLLIATHPDELPRGITHLLRVDRCRVVAQGRFVPRRARELFRSTGRERVVRLPAGKKHGDAEELVRLTGVTVRYGKRVIVENIHWTIRRGESWALLGPNGSGKSALLSLIIGDNPQAYANDVRIFGHRRGDGESICALKRRIGSVSPELHLHFPESETCLNTVVSGFADTYGCFHRPTPRQRAAARRWLARFGLAACENRPFGSLSAGWQRMTLLARALVKSPDLLVLDEPCQGLDTAHRARIVRTVEGLLRHTTVIFVTHRRDEIPPGIARVLRLA
jgi:molybdate transport system ATP-binding protein